MPLVDASKYPGIALLAITCCAMLVGCQHLLSGPEKDDKEEPPRTVYALGHLRPATGVIDIRATPGDRLKELAVGVKQNKVIPANGILGTLDSYDMGRDQLSALEQKKNLASQKYEHQKLLAAAQLAQANASKAQALAKQKEIELQAKKLTVLKAAVGLETTEYQMLEQLLVEDPELVTSHQLAKQKNKMDMAAQDFEIANKSYKSTKNAARLAVDAATASYAVAEMTNRQASKAFSEQLETKLIEQEIKVAKAALKRSILLAPTYSQTALDKRMSLVETNASQQATEEVPKVEVQKDSKSTPMRQYTVLKIAARDGETVTQAPIMQLGDLREMICVAEVYEADRKELYEKQKVIIRSPAFSGYFADGEIKDEETKERWGGIHGTVEEIGRMVAPPGLTSRNPLAPADRSVVEVLIKIDVEANQDAIHAAKEEFKSLQKKIDRTWGEDAIAHAAENVELEVTVEFSKTKEDKESADEADSSENSESSESQANS